jgi:ATP-dependent Clp protease ATP-binding subunit ClpA
VFAFVGPAGVGKSTLAAETAGYLFGRDTLIRLGAAHEADRLVQDVRRTPFGVVLFDHSSAADPAVRDVLVRIARDGRLTDSSGRIADFKNVLVIACLTADGRDDENPFGLGLAAAPSDRLPAEVEAAFPPGVREHLDGVIRFSPLGQAELTAILNAELASLCDRLAGNGMRLTVTTEAREFLLERAGDRETGGRAVGRAVRDHLCAPLAHQSLLNSFAGWPGISVQLDDYGEEKRLGFTPAEAGG